MKKELLKKLPEIISSGVSTDSRTLKKGEFFVALKGPSFDGGKFVGTAFKNGACGALVPDDCPVKEEPGKVIIKVRDTQKAFGEMAAYNRNRFKIPVVGVTGSNGKTTVKEMVWKILSSKFNVLKNEGTENNHIGVPRTLLRLNNKNDAAVIEIGMNHKGEILRLAKIARPTMAVITNVGPSHLEFLEGPGEVFSAKKEILKALGPKGVAILNGDDPYLSKIRPGSFKVVRFGLGDGNDLRASAISADPAGGTSFKLNGIHEFRIKLLGVHNVYNALSAIAVAGQFSIDYGVMRKALYSFEPGRMRLNLKDVRGLTVINDSYNSNPLSMRCALEVLKDYPAAKRWVVMGDMLELGKDSKSLHESIGKEIFRLGMSGVVALGDLSRHALAKARTAGMAEERLWHSRDHAEAAAILKKVARKGDAILIKGSRGMRMERVVELLEGQG